MVRNVITTSLPQSTFLQRNVAVLQKESPSFSHQTQPPKAEGGKHGDHACDSSLSAPPWPDTMTVQCGISLLDGRRPMLSTWVEVELNSDTTWLIEHHVLLWTLSKKLWLKLHTHARPSGNTLQHVIQTVLTSDL